MSDLDEDLVEAVRMAIASTEGDDGDSEAWEDYAKAAIRAYEAHKASAVPEEIAEVVRTLRGWCTDWNGEQMVDGECPRDGLHCDILRRAADLLEGYARPPSSSGDGLEPWNVQE